MSLIVPRGPSWAYCSTNMTGTPTGSGPDYGTSITSGTSSSDGTAVTLLSALAHDVEYLNIFAEGFRISGQVGDTLLDILIDPAGGTSWSSLIDDLLVGYLPAVGTQWMPYDLYHFPIWIPAGASIGARSRARRATAGLIVSSVQVFAYGGNSNPGSWWCGQSVETIGVTAANSAGTAHTPGNSGSYSSWADLGSTLSGPCGAVQFGSQMDNNSALNALGYYHEFGVGGARIGPPYYLGTSTSEDMGRFPAGPIFASLPAGTQFQQRATCSGTAQALQGAVYAVK